LESTELEMEAEDDFEDLPTAANAPNDLDAVDDEPPEPPVFAHLRSRSPSPAPKRVHLEDVPKRLNHRHAKRRDRRNTAAKTNGQIPRPETIKAQVAPQAAIPSALDASYLPAAHGSYSAKTEDRKYEKYGSKKRRSLTELLALGFSLVKWDGM
jgi:hypothetical protein